MWLRFLPLNPILLTKKDKIFAPYCSLRSLPSVVLNFIETIAFLGRLSTTTKYQRNRFIEKCVLGSVSEH
jgi:hypothetical protein